MLVSAVQQSESAIWIHDISSWISFPSVTTEELSRILVLYGRFSLVIYFIYGISSIQIYVNSLWNSSFPFSPLASLYICSLWLCLYFWFARNIIYTIFHPIYILKFHPFIVKQDTDKGTWIREQKQGSWRPAQSSGHNAGECFKFVLPR